MASAFRTLIAPEQLSLELCAPELVIVDCRASLADPTAGAASYAAAHLPGAVFADLLQDLSGPVGSGRQGRHPLPAPGVFAERLRECGVTRDSQVVAYDDSGGAFAARLWWMLRWLGHSSVAVLDGGLAAWVAAGRPLTSECLPRPRGSFVADEHAQLLVDAEQVAELTSTGQTVLIDARAPERFRGELEPVDAVAGHIPGARNLPFADNLERGRFRAPAVLRARIEQVLGVAAPAAAVVYCGSGVTACHDVLAFVHAGLSAPRLYAGSWSEWITDPTRGIERGEGS